MNLTCIRLEAFIDFIRYTWRIFMLRIIVIVANFAFNTAKVLRSAKFAIY